MRPDLLGLLLGIAFVAPTILLARRYRLEPWFWIGSLAALPGFYVGFGALAGSVGAMALEGLFGLPYVGLAIVLWRLRSPRSQAVLGVAWLTHGAYDLFHDALFVNPGVFAWYPVFCAVVDLAIGSYLLFLAWAHWRQGGGMAETRSPDLAATPSGGS